MRDIKAKDEVFLKTTSFKDAYQKLLDFARQVEDSESIPLKEALGRVLSVDIQSPFNVPHFARSSRDGYALLSSDTFGATEDKPASLRLVGEAPVGSEANVSICPGECVKVSTGAMIPRGADSVAMIEYTEEDQEEVRLRHPTSPGENITKVGADIKSGEVVARRGRRLTLFDLGVLASIGLSEANVYRKPRVAVMSTGNELVSAGKRLEPGKVYDVNSITIYEAVIESGGLPIDAGVHPDNFARISQAVNSSISSSDMVLISGGTSKGPGDLLPEVTKKIGKPSFYIHGIAMKPGKPTILAAINGKLLVTLPGYPTSALMVYYTLVDPVIRKMARGPPRETRVVKAYTSQRFYSELGRKEFKPCRISARDARGFRLVPMQTGSEAVTTLVKADGFIIIPENVEFIDENEEVELHLFPSRPLEIDFSSGDEL